jgi:signal peptidase II
MHRFVPLALWLFLAAIVVVLDQITKLMVESALPFGSRVVINSILDLVHVRNTGAAFSFLASASGWQREFFIAIAFAASAWIVWMLARAERGAFLFCAALSLILGGALGNVIDRIRLGGVVDFLYFHWGPHYWPAFNVADSAITCGAILFIVDALRSAAKHRRQTEADAHAEQRRPRQPN